MATLEIPEAVKGASLADMVQETMEQATVDILCCMDRNIPGTKQYREICSAADEQGMSYMLTSVKSKKGRGRGSVKQAVGSLTTFAGKSSWILNSGSLSLLAKGSENTQAQFAAIRINGNVLLVFNALFFEDGIRTEKQFQTLLHPAASLLNGEVKIGAVAANKLSTHFSAFVLNSNIHTFYTEGEIERIAAEGDMAVHRQTHADSGNVSLIVMAPKNNLSTHVHVGPSANLPHARGCTVALEIERIPDRAKTRSYLPLSFNERWLGTERRAFTA